MSIEKEIKKILDEYKQHIREILEIDWMIPGAYKEVKRKCGKPNCICNKGDGHILKRITWTENGKSYSRAVGDKYIDEVIRLTSKYREFKLKKRIIQKYEEKIHKLVTKFEKNVVKKTREKKSIND